MYGNLNDNADNENRALRFFKTLSGLTCSAYQTLRMGHIVRECLVNEHHVTEHKRLRPVNM